MIRESFDKAEEDMRERQVREARVEADNILAATEKAKANEAWTRNDRRGTTERPMNSAIRDLQNVYHGQTTTTKFSARDRSLNEATQTLAENMMNTAVRGALRGTKID